MYKSATAVNSGYYRVFVDSVQVSQHNSDREANERACNEKEANPDLEVYYDHDYRVVIENMSTFISAITRPSQGSPQQSQTAQPSLPSGILASEDWSVSPGAAWLATPQLAVGSGGIFTDSKFGNGDLSAGKVLDMSYLPGVAPDGSGVIRSAKPSNWTPWTNDPVDNGQKATNMFFDADFVGVFGTHRFRNAAFRGLVRHSGTPFMYDSHAGKLQYLQILVPSLTFTSADISGHQTLTVTGTWTCNTATGLYEGTATTGLTNIIDGTVLLPLTGNLVGSGESRPIVVKTYNPTTGAITARASMDYNDGGAAIPGYFYNAAVNDTFAVVFNMAEALVINTTINADVLFIQSNGLGWNVYLANDSTNYSPPEATTIVTQTHGVTITAAAQSNGARFVTNLYRDPATWEPGTIHCTGANDVTAFQLELTGWHLSTNGSKANMTANSPFNLAQNTNYFYFKDHSDEFYVVEVIFNCEQNPWHTEIWVTTEWGAQNLSSGTAGTRPGSTSAFGGEITHFNNYKLYEYDYPAPPLTLTSGDRSGMIMEWGSLAGNSYDTAPVGIYTDLGRVDVAASRIGTADIW